MPEKLLNIREVAEYLKISEEEVKRLVDQGEIPAYRIGDSFLRFRKEQLDAIKSEISEIEEHVTAPSAPAAVKASAAHPYTDLERDAKRHTPMARQYDYTPAEKLKDFFYYNDFYILSFAVICVLMYFIFRS